MKAFAYLLIIFASVSLARAESETALPRINFDGNVAKDIYDNMNTAAVLDGNVWTKTLSNLSCLTFPGHGNQGWQCSVEGQEVHDQGAAKALFIALPTKAQLNFTSWVKTWKNLTCYSVPAGAGITGYGCLRQE